jgi:hypothetical protein
MLLEALAVSVSVARDDFLHRELAEKKKKSKKRRKVKMQQKKTTNI